MSHIGSMLPSSSIGLGNVGSFHDLAHGITGGEIDLKMNRPEVERACQVEAAC